MGFEADLLYCDDCFAESLVDGVKEFVALEQASQQELFLNENKEVFCLYHFQKWVEDNLEPHEMMKYIDF